MAASLKGIDPTLKMYLKVHKLPDVYEALLTGLIAMCPENPHQFIIEALLHIKEKGLTCLEWDMFVDEKVRPNYKPLLESSLDYIFNFDENLIPSPEMNAKAYYHYNNHLKTMCFNAWMQFHLRKKRNCEEAERKWVIAGTHYKHRILRMHLYLWIQWLKFRKGRQAMAYNKIQHVWHIAIGRIVFEAWHNVTLDAKRTREYFERLERGENMEDEDLFGRSSGEARDDISMLPRRVAIMIFNYVDIADLARCSCVCRSWKVITQSSALWSKLDLSKVKYRSQGAKNESESKINDTVALRLLGKCRPYLVHLNLRTCSKVTERTFRAISECRNLQDLNLSECTALIDETLRIVAEGCKILLYLNVSHTDITDAALRSIAKNCTNLQFLSLAFCRKFTDRGLKYLAHGKGCKKLVYLDISGCIQITVAGFKYIATGCTSIHSLIVNEFPTLDDEAMEAVAEGHKNLTTVSLLGSPNISDDTFKTIAANKKLQKLKIEGNQRISDTSFKVIGKSCPDLHHLYVVDCQKLTDLTLKSLSFCRNLSVINLADCVRISDTGVRYIVEGPCGPKLQELNLTNCIRVGDMALVNIHKRCYNLTYLSVCFCEHISEAGIELLGQTHSLTSLDISGCNCGDQGLSALGNNPRFKDVCLSECVGITDLGLQKFAQQCREVERLDLSYCQNLTDGAIKNLAFCCRMLTVLNLAGCKLLTDLSIQYLSGVCHYLSTLDLSACVHVTDKALKYLRKGCKKMHILIILYCKSISKHAAQRMMRHIERVEYNNDEVPSYFGY